MPYRFSIKTIQHFTLPKFNFIEIIGAGFDYNPQNRQNLVFCL